MTILKTDESKTISKITGEPLKKRGRKPKNVLLQEVEQKGQNMQDNNDTNIVISVKDMNNSDDNDNDNNDNNDNATADNDNQNLNTTVTENETKDIFFTKDDSSSVFNAEEQKPSIKKRGRKPKGGKIIQQIVSLNNNKDVKPNIILHLKCSLKDLFKNATALGQATETHDFMSYNEYSYDTICKINNNNSNNDNSQTKDNYEEDLEDKNSNNDNDTDKDNQDDNCNNYKTNTTDAKNIYKKLKNLEHNLHINNINDKKSACFWCTYDFDNPPIYIPKHFIKNTYEVYGCFCSPECATAYLMEENIDSSDKFERYHLINNIYTKIYDYKKNIKPAPNPHYILDKYYGNLSIQEYRTLLRGERLFLVVDKPLTRILPELHEDNDDFIINNKIIPSNTYKIKKKIQKKQTKNNILNETFGISS